MVIDKPCPATACHASRRLRELLLEGSDAAERRRDRLGGPADRCTAGMWRHPRPEPAVVPVATGGTTNLGANLLRDAVDLAAQALSALRLQIGIGREHRVQAVDVRLVMLPVVNLHCLRIDVRFQGVEAVRKSGQCMYRGWACRSSSPRSASARSAPRLQRIDDRLILLARLAAHGSCTAFRCPPRERRRTRSSHNVGGPVATTTETTRAGTTGKVYGLP